MKICLAPRAPVVPVCLLASDMARLEMVQQSELLPLPPQKGPTVRRNSEATLELFTQKVLSRAGKRAGERTPATSSSRKIKAEPAPAKVSPGRVHKVIFLDVDGVLHEANFAPKPFRPDCMKALALLVQGTNARIILSSSWRLSPPGVKAVERALKRYDICKLSGFLEKDSTSRGVSIRNWMSQHHGQSDTMTHLNARFIALDDMDMSLELKQNLVLTRPKGMTERDALRGIAILNDEPLPEFSDPSGSDDFSEDSDLESSMFSSTCSSSAFESSRTFSSPSSPNLD